MISDAPLPLLIAVVHLSCIRSQYEVPSGGDWSVHRGATFEIVDSANVAVRNCKFDQIGGNGVLLSNNVASSNITGNEFVQCGDSAVVSVGSRYCRSSSPRGTGQFVQLHLNPADTAFALCFTAFVAKTPPLPCASTVFVAKTPPLPCVSTAFAAKPLPLPCVSTHG